MPAKSKAQYHLMQAASHGKVPGISKSTGREFVKATKSPKSLPARKK